MGFCIHIFPGLRTGICFSRKALKPLATFGGWVMIKVANAKQDMRVDVPTVGTVTIEKLAAANASCLVLEPGRTIILEKPKVIELADRYKIAVVGYEGEESPETGRAR